MQQISILGLYLGASEWCLATAGVHQAPGGFVSEHKQGGTEAMRPRRTWQSWGSSRLVTPWSQPARMSPTPQRSGFPELSARE